MLSSPCASCQHKLHVSSEPALKKVVLFFIIIAGAAYISWAVLRSVQESKYPLVKITTAIASSIPVPNFVVCAQDERGLELDPSFVSCTFNSGNPSDGRRTDCYWSVRMIYSFKFRDGPQIARDCAVFEPRGSIQLTSIQDRVIFNFRTRRGTQGSSPMSTALYYGFYSGNDPSAAHSSITTMGLSAINLEPNSYTSINGSTTYDFQSTMNSAPPFPGSGDYTVASSIILGVQSMKVTQQTEVSQFSIQDVITSILSVFGALSTVWAFLAGPGEHKDTGFIYTALEWFQLRASTPSALNKSEMSRASNGSDATETSVAGGYYVSMDAKELEVVEN
jgi:hypothetical protein